MRCAPRRVVAAASEAERHARAAHDEALAHTAAQLRQTTLGLGPVHVDEAVRQVQELLASSTDSVDGATLRRTLGKLLAMRGDFDVARDLIRGSIADAREAGLLLQAAAAAMTVAFVEVHAGDLETAERILRDGIDDLDRLGGTSYRWTTTLDLVEVLAYRGEYEEAATLCSDVRENINQQDLVDFIAVNALQGFLVARTGEHAEGERLSARAAEVAKGIDFYESKGQAFEWHARTLALVDKPAQARDAAATALAIYEAKGDAPASAWTRELLDSLSR